MKAVVYNGKIFVVGKLSENLKSHSIPKYFLTYFLIGGFDGTDRLKSVEVLDPNGYDY